ncbi:hypothetical protein Smlt0272 [Stenotrophomonas maltophilia K279a]|uniref:Uncharacterized protein n=1 Tax=Stenotrophomonas maltophilia (strain K279a) TaxID=522373 RepID=B2FI88_STRMK|nr:hypothetical protein Smlt0272 [Stenotrophomonas maltophilia K279a]
MAGTDHLGKAPDGLICRQSVDAIKPDRLHLEADSLEAWARSGGRKTSHLRQSSTHLNQRPRRPQADEG